MQAFAGIAPDHTATQLNRLSDDVFASNTLVDKLHTKVFAVFLPEALTLDKKEQNDFWGKPKSVLAHYPLDRVDVCVDGSLVTDVATTRSPTFSELGPIVAPNTSLTIGDSNADAVIYYTIDGDDPTSGSIKYTAAIPLGNTGETHVVRAIALAPGQASSPVTSMTYSVRDKAPQPTADVPSGTIASYPFNLTLSLAVPSVGLSIQHTTDGSDPLTSPTASKSDPGAAIAITAPETVTAVAIGANNAPSDPLVLTYH